MLLFDIAAALKNSGNAAQDTSQGISLLMLEGCLTVIVIGMAFCMPRLGESLFARIGRGFDLLARRKKTAVSVVGATALLLRLAILPLVPVPLPFTPNDFSFLLAADTFASGRLTNPTPLMWTHFETIHISMNPSYASMYFPSNGLVLAAGKVLFGNPWIGLLIASALMCAALCWMLQAWLPPTWAFLGGMLAVLRLGLFSYWINTYSGGGCIAALGGALVLGSLPRLRRTGNARYGILLALGVVLTAMTRPYEGVLLCLPCAIYLIHWLWRSQNRPSPALLLRHAALPIAIFAAAGTWMADYDAHAFGNPLTLPYTVNRATYAVAPYYVWQSQRPDPGYRHTSLRSFYYENELVGFIRIHKPTGFAPETLIKGVRAALFFCGLSLLPPLFMLGRVLRDRRIRFLVLCMAVLAIGMLIQIFLVPHYLAPFTAVFYAIGLQAMRHLRVWKPGGHPVGAAIFRFSIVICVVLGGLRLYAEPLHLLTAERPAAGWTDRWYGPGHFGEERAHIAHQLESLPGPQLVIVRYSTRHIPNNEWVYNAADIDKSHVIWAQDMSEAQNLELIHHYKDRLVWLVRPDEQPATLTPYPLPDADDEQLPEQITAQNQTGAAPETVTGAEAANRPQLASKEDQP